MYLGSLAAAQSFAGLPRIARFSLVHAGVMFVFLSALPSAQTLNPVTIPVMWAGAFAMTYVVMAVARM